MGGGLLADATWAVQTTNRVISGSPDTGINADQNVNIFPIRQAQANTANVGHVNFFSPLEGNILYMLVEVFSNSDSIGFMVELRRNASTSVITLAYGPLEIGRKAVVVNIPYLDQEFMQWRVTKPQNFSIVSFNMMLAGKL